MALTCDGDGDGGGGVMVVAEVVAAAAAVVASRATCVALQGDVPLTHASFCCEMRRRHW